MTEKELLVQKHEEHQVKIDALLETYKSNLEKGINTLSYEELYDLLNYEINIINVDELVKLKDLPKSFVVYLMNEFKEYESQLMFDYNIHIDSIKEHLTKHLEKEKVDFYFDLIDRFKAIKINLNEEFIDVDSKILKELFIDLQEVDEVHDLISSSYNTFKEKYLQELTYDIYNNATKLFEDLITYLQTYKPILFLFLINYYENKLEKKLTYNIPNKIQYDINILILDIKDILASNKIEDIEYKEKIINLIPIIEEQNQKRFVSGDIKNNKFEVSDSISEIGL